MNTPPDKTVRGKTRPGRLRALDTWLFGLEPSPLDAPGAVFVDIGFGEYLDTSVESARRLRERHEGLRVLALEREPVRVERARERAEAERVELELVEGFGWTGPRASVARAMNVLRQHRPQDVAVVHAFWLDHVLPGGLLVEGTCDRHGERLCAHLIRKTNQGHEREGLLFHCSFASGFAPIMLRDYLPQDLRRAVKPGTQIAAFFDDWTRAWEGTRGGARDPAEAFARAARALRDARPDVDAADALIDASTLVWRPLGGVDAPRDVARM